MAASTSVSHFSILPSQNLSQSLFVTQTATSPDAEPRTPANPSKSSHKAFRLNVSRSSSAMKLPAIKQGAGLLEVTIVPPVAQLTKSNTFSPLKPSKIKSTSSKNYVLDRTKLSPTKAQYRKGTEKKPTAVSIFDAEQIHTVLDTPPSTNTVGKDPTTFSAAVTQLSRLPRRLSPRKAVVSGQSTPQDRAEMESTNTESTNSKTPSSMVTIKKRNVVGSSKFISPKKGQLISLQEATGFFCEEDYWTDLIKTCWSTLTGQTSNSKLSLNQVSEIHNYFAQNHRTMQIMKNDCITERPAPIQYKRKNPERKLLLLDLDETLIHCTGDASQKHRFDLEVDFINHEGIPLTGYMNVRPYTNRFLEVMSNHFEVVVFTASMKYYADRILKIIDPHRQFISDVFYRDSCCRTRNEKLVKDLTIFKGIPLSEMILVDNNTYCMWPQPDNGIPIINFEHDRKDQELLKLEPFLLSLRDAKNHHLVLRNQFKITQLLQTPTLAQYYSCF